VNLYSAFIVVNTPLSAQVMAQVLKRSHSFTCAPRVSRHRCDL